MKKPLILCILDGCGVREETNGNAFKNAYTPTIDFLMEKYPNTVLEASGNLVGLPKGQMGNSEVGHMNIGAGRIVYQPLELINHSIETKEFFSNQHILNVINHAKSNNSKLHIMGLISDGGIHSHIDHLLALVDMCKNNNVDKLYFHLFTDGRDTGVKTGAHFVEVLENKIKELGIGNIVSISGRYYGMDRDNNYDRLKLSYDAICYGIGKKANTPQEMFKESYNENVTDEFIIPTVFSDNKLDDNDGIIVFNYRPDRLREMFTAITNPNESPLEEKRIYNNVKMVSMMHIYDSVKADHAFELEELNKTLGEYISDIGLSQLRIAETEKYAHVTHFFDGDKDLELKNMKKILVPSPKVSTYDLKPEMSALEVTDKLIEELDKDYLDIIILNYANGDMVGHTGVYDAAVKAVEFMDECLKRIYDKVVVEKNGIMIVTADHGNCDVMINDDGTPCTTHTTNKVPFVVTKEDVSLNSDGKLADIAPTILDLMNIPIPSEYNGKSLIK